MKINSRERKEKENQIPLNLGKGRKQKLKADFNKDNNKRLRDNRELASGKQWEGGKIGVEKIKRYNYYV